MQLMEFLHATVTNNYFTSFRLLTHLGVDNIWATKIGYANAIPWGKNSRKKKKKKKKEYGHFAQRPSTKKAVEIWQWLVWTTTERCT